MKQVRAVIVDRSPGHGPCLLRFASTTNPHPPPASCYAACNMYRTHTLLYKFYTLLHHTGHAKTKGPGQSPPKTPRQAAAAFTLPRSFRFRLSSTSGMSYASPKKSGIFPAGVVLRPRPKGLGRSAVGPSTALKGRLRAGPPRSALNSNLR